MTRLAPAPATPLTRVGRAVLGIGAAIVLAIAASGCASEPPPAPTPDPFAGVAERSDQAFREGLEAYGQGKYRDALTAFERAKVLSPSADPRIEQMVERSRAALAPTPTPVPPTPTSVPVTPTATPATISTLVPDADLGQRYFGKVALSVVPGKDAPPVAGNQFFFQDQLGLHIEGLSQRLRLPFTLRVFNRDSGRLVAEVHSESNTTAAGTATPSLPGMTSAPTAAPSPMGRPETEFQPMRFWTSYVWYHEGGEEPGRYRLEVFANGTLTHTFEYSVGTVPVASPEPTRAEVALDPSPTLPVEPAPKLEPEPIVVDVPKPAAAPAAPVVKAEPTATPQPTPMPTATPVPTPSTANATQIGGVPAGLDVNLNDGRIFVADASGVIWTTDPQRKSFNRPLNLDRLPVDLAVDQTTGNVFVSARNEPAVLVLDASGRVLKTIGVPVTPGDVQLDPELGLLFVVLPEKQALGVVDVRAGRLLHTINGLPQVTALALDPMRHTLYAGHLAGQVSIIDVPSSQLVGRVTASGVGLASIATARGLAYAVNTVSHELSVIEPVSQTVSRYKLDTAAETIEPAAVAAAEDSGAVYVLASRPNIIVRIDPTDGTELGRVLLPERSGRFGIKVSGQGDFQGLRARMALNRLDETLYLTLPEAGTLTVVPIDQFPVVAHEIPVVDPGEFALASTIPGVIRPAAAPLPDQPVPALRAQTSSSQEGN